jgi:hypothetical protein
MIEAVTNRQSIDWVHSIYSIFLFVVLGGPELSCQYRLGIIRRVNRDSIVIGVLGHESYHGDRDIGLGQSAEGIYFQSIVNRLSTELAKLNA